MADEDQCFIDMLEKSIPRAVIPLHLPGLRSEFGFEIVDIVATVPLQILNASGVNQMKTPERYKRLSILKNVPKIAAIDHRYFLDKNGKDTRLESLPRKARRKLAAQARHLAAAYNRTMETMRRSGVGYPVDKLIRELAFEYTHRYATSGLFNQPINFNYFEPFCDIKLIENSVAPYAEPAPELDHLFSVVDYFDYITSPDGKNFQLSSLKELPEGRVFHFTANGEILDFTYMTATGREFVISGFSMVRRGNSLHWYVLGGELYSEPEWKELDDAEATMELENINPAKRLFLSKEIKRTQGKRGGPVALEGTTTARRTAIAGETDLNSCKHLARCYMSEHENFFNLECDDPDIFEHIKDDTERAEAIDDMRSCVEGAAVMWNLAEAMFQLAEYFVFKIKIAKKIAVSSGQKISSGASKRGRGVGGQFRTVSAIEIADQEVPVVREYTVPHYQVETEGFWRRVPPDRYGRDADGNQILGKTWIVAKNKWRERLDEPKTIYVKSSVSAAKISEKEYIDRASAAETKTV